MQKFFSVQRGGGAWPKGPNGKYATAQNHVLVPFDFSHKQLKMPIHAPKLRFGGFDKTPKRHILAWKDVIRRIDRQNRSIGATGAPDEETKKNKERSRADSGKLDIRRFAQTIYAIRSTYRLAWWVITRHWLKVLSFIEKIG